METTDRCSASKKIKKSFPFEKKNTTFVPQVYFNLISQEGGLGLTVVKPTFC